MRQLGLTTAGRKAIRRFPQLACLALFSMAAAAHPAGASVTLGQLAPGVSPPADCANPSPFDLLQPTVTSGNSYVVPAAGTITSWSHNASADAGQALALKVFRNVSGATYAVVGHDGPRPVTASTVNTFSGLSIPVKPGDVIGLNDGPPSACAFAVPGDSILERPGDLADGASGAFNNRTGVRANVTAALAPTNTFTLGRVTRNKKKGTATLTASLPNPGELTASGSGVKAGGAAVISKAVTAPGETKLLIKAKGKKKRKLNETGKVKLNVKVAYTPTGGDPSKQSLKVTLRKK
jgi:hypothetical protein